MTGVAGLYRFKLEEGDVRLLCGPVRFERASELQEAGHVIVAGIEDGALRGIVRGTWQRQDDVRISIGSSDLVPHCTCQSGGFCRHAGALLLHWLRRQDAFSYVNLERLTDVSNVTPDDVSVQFVSPIDELGEILDGIVMTELRSIGRARGLRVKASTKAEMIEKLSKALADPELNAEALADLGQEDIRLLAAVHLSNATAPNATGMIQRVFESIGGDDLPAEIESYQDRGLIFVSQSWESPNDAHQIVVPRAIAASLPTISGIVSPARVDHMSDITCGSDWIGGLILTLAHAASEGELHRRAQSKSTKVSPGVYDWGHSLWNYAPLDAAQSGSGSAATARESMLIPTPPLADRDSLSRLHNQTGRSPEAIEFTVRLLVACGVLRLGNHFELNNSKLVELLCMTESQRRTYLAQLWHEVGPWMDLALLTGEWGAIEIGGASNSVGYSWSAKQTQMTVLRRLLTRLIARLSADEWYRIEDVVSKARHLIQIVQPNVARRQNQARLHGRPQLWVAEKSASDTLVDVNSPEGWTLVVDRFLLAMLTGPISWMGLIDVARDAHDVPVMRARPEAGALIGRPFATVGQQDRPRLHFGDEMSLILPFGSSNSELYARMTSIGQLEEVSSDGAHYRLSIPGLQRAFRNGDTAHDLLRFFEEHAAEPVPLSFRQRIEHIWHRYGRVRLYDDVSLIELSDDLLLPELSAATSLARHVLHQFSPRLIAVETAVVDELNTELSRLGYSPRLIEEG